MQCAHSDPLGPWFSDVSHEVDVEVSHQKPSDSTEV
jgi:hypothetical protein